MGTRKITADRFAASAMDVKFGKASEELISLGFFERNKSGGTGFSRDRSEIPLVAREHGFVASRLDGDEPGTTRQEIYAARLEKGRRSWIDNLQHLWIERRVYKQAAKLEGAGRSVESDERTSA